MHVEFEITTYRKNSKNKLLETKRQYRIVRTAIETIDGDRVNRTPSTVKLFQITENGSVPIEPPDAWMGEELPRELREVFLRMVTAH